MHVREIRFFSFAAAALLAACATQPAGQASVAPDARSAPPHCLRETGSRLPARGHSCGATPGRVYTQEDLQRAGGIDLNQALHNLGPY
jgi:hypothetical protein